MTQPLLPALLAASIALAASHADAAPATGVVAPRIDTSPTQKRLRMRLAVTSTTDMTEGPGNTEDEIYYAIVGLPYVDDSLPQMKTVKRAGSPDIWEMGPNSAPTLHRTLFKGNSSPLWANSFMLVIAEQDNQWLGLIETLLSGGLITLQHAIDGMYSNPSDAQQVVAKLNGEFKAIAQRVKADNDQIVGAVAITMKGSRLQVETSTDLHSKMLDDDPHHPLIELSGSGYKYELRLFIEDVATTPPVIHDFIGLEHDACGGELWIETTSGSIQVAKGQQKGFVPKSHEFNWFCDGDDESTNASTATDYVIASRASSGGAITWKIFKDYTPSADLSW